MEQAKPQVRPIFKTEDVKKVEDGFQNFAARLGVTERGTGRERNLLSHGNYQLNLVTRNRVLLENAYRGSWIVGQVIDTIADDMTRAGLQIKTNDGAEDAPLIEIAMKRLQVWQLTGQGIRWGRLYGGAVCVLQIKGQNLEDEIDLDTVDKGDFLGLSVYDRWQLYPVLDKLIQEGPDLGLPAYYDVVLGSNLNDPGQEPGGQETLNANGRVRIHHSRLIRMIGIQLPFFQAITEMMWGESVLERMWDRLIAFDDATLATANLINRAQLRTVGIMGLREILAAGGPAQEALVAQFEYMRMFQSNEGITLLDKEDMFNSTAYSFAGLSDVLIQMGQQVSGAANIPLVKLFGQSPAGMNATGEADIRMYYDYVNGQQESKLRNFFEILLKVLWRSEIGHEAPEDMTFDFTPLWQMSATDKATVAKTNTDTIIEAHDAGLITTEIGMQELKQASTETGLFSNITDEDIADAENEEPPMPGEPGAVEKPGETTGDPGEGPTSEAIQSTVETSQPINKDESPWKKVRDWVTSFGKVRDKGVEATMKEFEKGTLKSGSGQKVTSKKQALAIGYSEEGKDQKPKKMTDDQKKIRDYLK